VGLRRSASILCITSSRLKALAVLMYRVRDGLKSPIRIDAIEPRSRPIGITLVGTTNARKTGK
jgi:hypothetical protein